MINITLLAHGGPKLIKLVILTTTTNWPSLSLHDQYSKAPTSNSMSSLVKYL